MRRRSSRGPIRPGCSNWGAPCSTAAILFAGGNGDFDVCSYLQLHEGYRRDVSVLPVGYTDRPWYAGYLRDGLEGAQRPLALSLSDEQILEMRPFKWDTLEVRIPVSEALREEFSLPEDAVLAWTVAPDFASERLNGKLNDEKARPRTYLSPQRAVMLQIVEDNYASRPIFSPVWAIRSFSPGSTVSSAMAASCRACCLSPRRARRMKPMCPGSKDCCGPTV